MKIFHEIEYKDGNNEYAYLEVEFEAFPRWENDGIGSYEYWGHQEYDKGYDYVSLEHHGDPTWDEKKYTEEQNRIINEFKNDTAKWKALCDYFCEEFAAYEPDYDE